MTRRSFGCRTTARWWRRWISSRRSWTMPTSWGAIAAANAVSDVYAMGGTPLFALNLVGWPREKLPFELLGDVLGGATARSCSGPAA